MANKVYHARRIIMRFLKSDPDFRRAYRDNIAMYLWDKKREGITFNKQQCNEVADGLIKLLFES